jgi:hypothetical protein
MRLKGAVLARVALKCARAKNPGRADEAFKRCPHGGRRSGSRAPRPLWDLQEIRDEDVAGLQSALRSHARIDAGVALMEFVSPRREQPKDQGTVADCLPANAEWSARRRTTRWMISPAWSDAAADGQHARF